MKTDYKIGDSVRVIGAWDGYARHTPILVERLTMETGVYDLVLKNALGTLLPVYYWEIELVRSARNELEGQIQAVKSKLDVAQLTLLTELESLQQKLNRMPQERRTTTVSCVCLVDEFTGEIYSLHRDMDTAQRTLANGFSTRYPNAEAVVMFESSESVS